MGKSWPRFDRSHPLVTQILCIIPLLAGIYSVFFDDDPYNSQDVYSLIPLIATTILFTFGWIMAYILSRVGLLIVSRAVCFLPGWSRQF